MEQCRRRGENSVAVVLTGIYGAVISGIEHELRLLSNYKVAAT